MTYRYKAFSGDEIIVEGCLIAENEQEASAKVFQKIRQVKKGQTTFTNALKITLNDQPVFEQSKVFEKPVYKKLQTRVIAPWKM